MRAAQGDIVDIEEASSPEAGEEAGGPWVLLDDGTIALRYRAPAEGLSVGKSDCHYPRLSPGILSLL